MHSVLCCPANVDVSAADVVAHKSLLTMAEAYVLCVTHFPCMLADPAQYHRLPVALQTLWRINILLCV